MMDHRDIQEYEGKRLFKGKFLKMSFETITGLEVFTEHVYFLVLQENRS